MLLPLAAPGCPAVAHSSRGAQSATSLVPGACCLAPRRRGVAPATGRTRVVAAIEPPTATLQQQPRGAAPHDAAFGAGARTVSSSEAAAAAVWQIGLGSAT
ncbi:hypothetical protein MNEG_13903, partial [Monoraphidium neglectum]